MHVGSIKYNRCLSIQACHTLFFLSHKEICILNKSCGYVFCGFLAGIHEYVSKTHHLSRCGFLYTGAYEPLPVAHLVSAVHIPASGLVQRPIEPTSLTLLVIAIRFHSFHLLMFFLIDLLYKFINS